MLGSLLYWLARVVTLWCKAPRFDIFDTPPLTCGKAGLTVFNRYGNGPVGRF